MTTIYMRNVEGKQKMRALTQPLCCMTQDGKDEYIPVDFEWDGSSVPIFFQMFFPRHRHPVASAKHDWRSSHAKNKKDRAFADKEFRKDVRKTSWRITAILGYVGVRVGAFLGIGSRF